MGSTMAQRLSSKERRVQIVEATLKSLASTPIERITTRQIARELEISQPALFRHFRSRDEILEAVVAHTREQLADLADGILRRHSEAPLQALEALAHGVMTHVAQNPGMPRLLFHDVARGESTGHHAALQHLVAMQRGLVAELVRQAQARRELDPGVDPAAAGALFVALVQGVLLQWQLGGRQEPLDEVGPRIARFWEAAVRHGEPAPEGTTRTATQAPPTAGPLVMLDVRPLLARGADPLDTILEALQRTPPGGLVEIVAPFRPTPLLTLLERRGYRSRETETDSGDWRIEVLLEGSPDVTDLSHLEAPEPLERVLSDAARLEPGETLLARVPRFPRLLFPHLEERGLDWDAAESPDGTALVQVRRPA